MPATSPPKPSINHGSTTAEWQTAHRALKRNEALWRSLAFQGFQPDSKGRLHEVRSCPCCQSTLLRPISHHKATVLYLGLLAICEQVQHALAQRSQGAQQRRKVVSA